MRFLTLALLAALPLSAHQRVYFRAGHHLPRPVVMVRPGPAACAPAPVVIVGHRHRWHRHHRRPVIVLR